MQPLRWAAERGLLLGLLLVLGCGNGAEGSTAEAGGAGASGGAGFDEALGGVPGEEPSDGGGQHADAVCDLATLQATPAAPQAPGATVELSAAADCTRGAEAEFRFLVQAPDRSGYEELADWGAAGS